MDESMTSLQGKLDTVSRQLLDFSPTRDQALQLKAELESILSLIEQMKTETSKEASVN